MFLETGRNELLRGILEAALGKTLEVDVEPPGRQCLRAQDGTQEFSG